jgi:hypothetical protein
VGNTWTGLLVAGATARLTRLVTTDDLGWWAIRLPAYAWAGFDPYDDPNPGNWAQKLVSGLDCPFCVGTWIGYGVLTADATSQALARRGHPAPARLLRFALTGLALNYLVGHLEARLSASPDPDPLA